MREGVSPHFAWFVGIAGFDKIGMNMVFAAKWGQTPGRIALAIVLTVLAAGAGRDDGRIDLAEFGRVVEYTGDTPETLQVKTLERGIDGWEAWKGPDGQYTIGLEFDEPRDLAEAGVEFRHAIADRQLIQVQYWQDHWPNDKKGGWAPVDDPFHGKWANTKGDWWAGDRDVNFGFLPYNQENPRKGAPDFTYRRTYRLRFLLGKRDDIPPVRYIHAYGPNQAVEGDFEIKMEAMSPIRLPLDVSAVNGMLLEGKNRVPTTALQVDNPPMNVAVRYAQGDLETSTRTIVTLRAGGNELRGMSFLPAEAAKCGTIHVPAMGVTVTHRGPAQTQAAEQPGASVYDRLATQPAQSFERARRELPELDPRKQGRYVPLAPPDARQEIAVVFDGSVLVDKSALKVPADDSKRMKWPADQSILRLSTDEPPTDLRAPGKVKQERLDGYLPIIRSTWVEGHFAYEQTAVATYLNGEPAQPRGDETVVLLVRLIIRNTTREPRDAVVRLMSEPGEELVLEGNDVLASGLLKGEQTEKYPRPYYRLCAAGEAGSSLHLAKDGKHDVPSGVVLRDTVSGQNVRVVRWAVPYVDLTAEERARIGPLLNDFDKVMTSEADRWRKLVGQAASFELPDPLLNDFCKAALVNLRITSDLDPFNGMVVLPAGTYGYNVCLNESCHQVWSLEVRGLHADAQKYLDAMVKGQSSRGLHGRFTDKTGVFHGMPTATGNYQTFNYNLDHGFVMWMLNEHYRYTRDREWLAKVAPALVEACDFVTRQCNVPPESNTLAREDRNWGIGLLPPGHLEDPPEWLWWFAVNAYAWRGMQDTAASLREIGHPEADRILRDAAVFGDTLRRSCRESMVRAPVVRLRDGTYIPFQPTRSRLRGRDVGWIRDALYGPIHLIDCGVYPPDSPEAEWILRDAEDNVFIGGQRGYELRDYEQQWFSWGGMTLQPNLLPVPLEYLARNMPNHALRSFYNPLCASVYADVRCFAEWVPYPGRGGGPFLKTPDESAFVVWLRHMLIAERGDDLDLLGGVPADWLAPGKRIAVHRAATWFGPMDLEVQRRADARELSIDLNAPARNPPQWIRIHAGVGGRIVGLTVNGKAVTAFDAKAGTIELPGKVGRAKVVVAY